MTAKTEKKKILIVEDNKNMQSIYKDIFLSARDRYDIDIQDCGLLSFKKVQDKKFDLVILDMVMEGMSGDTLFACMREYDRLMDVPVIVVSVLGSDDEAVQFVTEQKNTYFLQKPITGERLLETIEGIFKA